MPKLQYPIGNVLVPYGTPLHVTELFLRLLKLVFSNFPEDYPYKFVADDFDKTGIVFDVQLNKESEIFGKKPLVIISRGGQNSSPLDLGDMSHLHFPSNHKWGANVYSASTNFQVVSKTKAEAEIISQIIFGFLMTSRTLLPKFLNLHMVQSIMLGEVNKMEDDDEMYVVQGMFSYVGQYQWTQNTDDPILKSIGVTVDKMLRP